MKNAKKILKILFIIIIVVFCIIVAIDPWAPITIKDKIKDKIQNKEEQNEYRENVYKCTENDTGNWDFSKFTTVDKPIIYLYPEEDTEIIVKLGKPELLTCTYPKYDENTGWKVTAKTDGTLIDEEVGREYYSLYWEGKKDIEANMADGFVVSGEDTVKFLEEKLEVLGLTEKEAQEFIIYWLPQMENNEYNLIRFETKEEIEENMPLNVVPAPDTVIRIMMDWKALDEYMEIPEQELVPAERDGYTVVEWGGSEIK